MTAFGYAHLFAAARRWRWVVPGCVLAAVVFCFILLNILTPRYTAEMILGPTAHTGVAGRGIRLPVEQVLEEKIRHNPAEINHNETLSDFARVIQLLTSPEVARQLLVDDTLAIEENLLSGKGFFHGVKQGMWRLAGQRLETAPGPVVLSQLLKRRVTVDTVGISAMRRVTFRHHDRQFATALLEAMYTAADTHLRLQAQERAMTEIAYLRAALDRVSQADQRKALLDVLATQEQARLLLAVNLPFAADPIQGASAPVNPDWPDVGLVLFFAVCLGLFAGVSAIYALAVREWAGK